ncbi:hypothetical protein AB0A63_28435 [Lentzea sp. NPDC042327]|uniref:hypothetical protein n=1 Tax=Lentzea sp. NPDC042327 TaxID=3154801 RepID=UPI0033F604BA
MQDDLTGEDVFSEIFLLRGNSDKTIIVVEGPSDLRTFELHVDEDQVELVVGHDRPRVQRAIDIVDKTEVPKVVGVVDSDLDRFFGADPDSLSANLIATEYYDLESDLFFWSDVADRVIRAYASVSSLRQKPDGCDANKPTDMIVKLCLVVGALRLISQLHSYNLMLRELPLGACIDRKIPSYRYTELAALIKSKSKASVKSDSEIEILLTACAASGWNDLRSCCGHDLISILTGALDVWWGNRVSKENVRNALRVAVDLSQFKKMKVGRLLAEWAAVNNAKVWRDSA